MDPLTTSHDTTKAFAQARAAAEQLRASLPASLSKPRIAIVCGSGLGGLQYAVPSDSKVEVPYDKVPGMPTLSVEGHEGKMVFGIIGEGAYPVPIVLFVGRAHFFEGHDMGLVTYATRVSKCLGVETLICINPSYKVGDLVLLNDHLNFPGLVGVHPLRGPNDPSFGVRFPPLSDAYDLDLRRRAHHAWESMKPSRGERTLHEGVYAYAVGPTYETRAECRLLHILGADVVGMSTVPDVIVARHSGIRVLAMSLVTNNGVSEPGPRGDDPRLAGMSVAELNQELIRGMANHEEVLEAGKQAAGVMVALVIKIVQGLAEP